MASLRKGETVLDLGSGAGFDCFLASKKVGEKGKVIGVGVQAWGDRKPASADNSVDAIISNCVINLSPEKNRVFKEAKVPYENVDYEDAEDGINKAEEIMELTREELCREEYDEI